MKPSIEMQKSPAYIALGASARSVLRIIMEEIGATGGAVALNVQFFADAGVSATAVVTGVADLLALDFIAVTGKGRTPRAFSLSGGWRTISDQVKAERRLAAAKAAKAAQRPARRRRAAASIEVTAADAAGDRPLPEGVRRAMWPQLAWLQRGGDR